MLGTRQVIAATWKSGKKLLTGCWEYSTIFDKFDVWLDKIDPLTGNRAHIIVEGSSESGPEWGPWKLVKPEQISLDNPWGSDKTEP